MNDTDQMDEIDRVWRDGLRAGATFAVTPTEPTRRVEARVRRRRHVHTATTAALALVAVVAVATGAGLLLHDGHHTRVETRPTRRSTPAPAPTVVAVTDAPGGVLRIEFPGRRVTGNPPQITLPAGDIRFVISSPSGGHALAIDGVPGFRATFDQPGTITQVVHLDPAVYRMECLVPGHAEAGEEMLLVVH